MAFQQPTRPAVPRAARHADDHDAAGGQALASPEPQLQASQAWVLFSPPTDVTTSSYLSETEPSLDTPGRSRLSELGSLHSAVRSAQLVDAQQAAPLSALDALSVEDDAELDSLDSHLPEFRWLAPTGVHHTLPVLPTHDGLGSFHLDRPHLDREAQDQIYQFERFNPRRVRRRLDSFDGAQLEAEHGQDQEDEKRLRIEAWRLEHSRVFLDEVQRETRRRRKSQVSMQRFQCSGDAESDNMTWHDEDHGVELEQCEEGLLASITRNVVSDLLGIDDRLLSVLLGETLAEDDGPQSPLRHHPLLARVQEEPSWPLRILEKLSRELGLLVTHLSHHPGAFSTYTRVQFLPLPYAGLPVIPESGDAPQTAPEATEGAERPSQPSAPEFEPTLPRQPQAQASGTRRRRSEDVSDGHGHDTNTDKGHSTFTQDEWERDLDVKLVFRYLMSRFTSPPNSSAASGSHVGAATAQDSTAKMSRVRQHHPLIARSRPVERRSFRAAMPASPGALRHHSSCASQSTRRSARRSSCSSRHYWDIGGSLGTGSMIASHGPMGSWGEV